MEHSIVMKMFALATLLLMTSGVASLSLEERISRLEGIEQNLARQVNLEGYYSREMLRSVGDSGIVNSRLESLGNKNYYSTSHTGHSFMAIHDHPEYKNTVGLGELDAVMNGYHFRTRHNDYQMVMPSKTSTDYHATQDITQPEVPYRVQRQKNLQEEIRVMRIFFEAFKKQDYTIAYHLRYFKPYLCYMEGAWTHAGENLDEPFHSELHSLEAGNWEELLDKARFASYSGSSSSTEDNAFLPTMIYGVDNGKPLVAQWNYRILCHPLKAKLEAKHLVPLDDLSFRLPNGLNPEEAKETMGQRFYDAFRGYNDASLWVAQTTHDKVIKLKSTVCHKVNRTNVCTTSSVAYTYAIPLEIVFTNPLMTWNPYGVTMEDKNGTVKDVTEGGKRNGGLTDSTAFLGASSRHFYTTPIEFYSEKDYPVPESVGVLDKDGKVRRLVSSGVRTFTPDIPGVGRVRLRYPIAPLHGEGETLWKELNALKDMVMKQTKYGFLYEDEPCYSGNGTYVPSSVRLELASTSKDPPGEHSHTVTIPYRTYKDIMVYGKSFTVDTSLAQGHSHTMMIGPTTGRTIGIAYSTCDGKPTCWDGHPRILTTLTKFN